MIAAVDPAVAAALANAPPPPVAGQNTFLSDCFGL